MGCRAGDLAFLIHFVGDIHQPLRTTTNADRSGTCQQGNVEPAEKNLHYVWDDAVVTVLEHCLCSVYSWAGRFAQYGRSHVTQILDVPADKDSVEKAMVAVSIRPDT